MIVLLGNYLMQCNASLENMNKCHIVTLQVTLPEGAKGLAVKCIAENERIGHQVATQKILRVQCKDQFESYHYPYL